MHVPEVSFTGTPWYNPLSNQTYIDAFNYIGPHIAERDLLTKDKVVKKKVEVESSDESEDCAATA